MSANLVLTGPPAALLSLPPSPPSGSLSASARGVSGKRRSSPRFRLSRDGAFAPWLEREAEGMLVQAGLGQAFPDREEFEMGAFPATSDGAAVLVTAAGYAQLCAELEALRTVSRQELSEQLRDVREDGDSDNPMLFDLLEEQVLLEGRIALLEAQAAAARIVGPAADGTAGIGSCVRVRHGDSGEVAEYELVGPIESDVGNGRVSVGAPVGRALVGRRGGATVAVETPQGTMQLELLSVGPVAQRAAKEAA